MKKNVHISVYISFSSETSKSDIENIFRNLGYEFVQGPFLSEGKCNFVKDIEIDIDKVNSELEALELRARNTLEKCGVKAIQLKFFGEYSN